MNKTFLTLPVLLGLASCTPPAQIGATKSPTYTAVQSSSPNGSTAQTHATAPSSKPAETPTAGFTTLPGAGAKGETLIMTIYEDWGIGSKPQIILTHQDGTQEIRFIKWPAPYSVKNLAIREDSLMTAIGPLLLEGWKVVSSTATGGGTTASTETTRIFFRKEGFQ